MKEYIVRFLIAGIMAICVSLLILGGSQTRASGLTLNEEWIWPTEGTITDVFGTRGGTHKGIDIAGELNDPVMASKEGVVTKSYLSASYGHVILIKHPDGYESVYAHLNKRLANVGDYVEKGQKIGTMGNTGLSTGTHLHFELHKQEWTYEKENAINPAFLLGTFLIGEEIAANQIKKPEVSVEAGAAYKGEGDIHNVSRGETLWGIAITYDLTVNQLMDMNTLNDTIIYPGQKLKVSIASAPAVQELNASAIIE